MKKKYFFVLICAVLLLGGCKKGIKTIECTGKSSGMDVNLRVEYDEKASSLISQYVEYILDVSSYSSSELEDIKKKDLCSQIKDNYKLLSCSMEIKEKNIHIYADFDMSRYKNVRLKEDSVNEVVKSLEKEFNGKCNVLK